MKGKEKVIQNLNTLLAHELGAINQYMVHAEMCDNWGYKKLHDVTKKRAIEEMKHAEKIIERILFLEGIPIVTNLGPVHIGADVPNQLKHDKEAEAEGIGDYNQAIALAMQEGDAGTAEILKDILKDEEGHLDFLEAQLDQINQMGLQTYLAEQLGE
jgi:bacterioferritin